jgi:hypothetical protein
MNEINSSDQESQQQEPVAPEKIECRSTKDPAIRVFILAAMFLGFGGYSVFETQHMGKYPYAPLAEDLNAWFSWLLNYCGPFVFIPVGVIFLIIGILYIRRRLVADQDGIGYVGKTKLKWDDVSQLDAKRLKSKGIIALDHEGGKLVLDSYKLTDFKNLLKLIEQKIPQDKQIS